MSGELSTTITARNDLMEAVGQMEKLSDIGIDSKGIAEAAYLVMLRATPGYEQPLLIKKVSFGTSQDEGLNGDKPSKNEATIKFQVWGKDCHEVAEGDGPVDAFSNALKKGVSKIIPEVADIHLDNYSVSLVNPSAETAAMTKVAVTVHYKDMKFTTIDCSKNVLIASAVAISDAYELCLHRIMVDDKIKQSTFVEGD